MAMAVSIMMRAFWSTCPILYAPLRAINMAKAESNMGSGCQLWLLSKHGVE